ncbi:SGNH hydrolase-type esterase domain-containing protein [Sphaerosporella brunnea]|uniref:SGNH hydrolase-type esterase domain-containing protein n=1 Tax=Sphaerosporella brunnea TaxID=1250544 RepID=A0A5J5EVF4_9PEZI|nr:SGNH hydrolase-type esterase domain-containing protein [Sphaerosporella brunnea]
MASPPSIVLFGDSLTEQAFSHERHGFAASLAESYVRRADVLNRGLSGYNSDWLLSFLEKVLAAQVSEVLLWVIWIGANDACLPEFPFHVPLDRYRSNLGRMVSLIRSHAPSKNAKILFLTPPPVDIEMLKVHHRRKGRDRRVDVTESYAEACLEVARGLGEGVGVIDFHKAVKERVVGSWSLQQWMTDGLHLGPKGYKLLNGMVKEYIATEWKELKPANVPLMAPWVGDLEVVKEWEKAQVKHDEL